jgi:hypothetical protein
MRVGWRASVMPSSACVPIWTAPSCAPEGGSPSCRRRASAATASLRGSWALTFSRKQKMPSNSAGISRLDGLNPAWDGLRNTINRLPRTDRRTLLHALMPFCVDFPEEEANQGLRRAKVLWTTVSKRVPTEAIPDSWDVERLEDTIRPQRAADFLATGVFAGDSESAQRDRFLMGSLAKTLYRLGLQVESQAESSTPLILDPEILRTRGMLISSRSGVMKRVLCFWI